MSERLKLAENFIGGHGLAAARALEELPPEVASGLIDAIADPLSVSVLKSMLPYHAAKCLAALLPAAGSKYLAALPPKDAAAILRHTDEASCKNLLELLPRRQALRVSLILGYPQSLIGAWIDPLTLSLPSNSTVADAKKRIRNEGYEHRNIYVVDDDFKIRGSVSLVQLLLQAGEDTSLSAIMIDVVGALNAATTLEHAVDAKGWADNDVLPVIDRNQRFIGVLRYAVLRRALVKPSIADHAMGSDDKFLGITEACYLGLADLMATTLAADHHSPDSK